MKKVAMVLVLILSVGSLVSCSKSSGEVASVNGNIMLGSKVLEVTEYRGKTAMTELPDVGKIEYYLCNTMEDCDHNNASVLVEDMTDYKDNSKYYTLYHGTHVYMYVPCKDGYIESHTEFNDVGLMPVEQVIDVMYAESKRLVLQEETKEVSFNEIVTLNVNDIEYIVRKNEIIIPNLLRIKVNDGSVVANEHVVIGEKSLAKMSTDKYDYYQCDDVLIQAAIGTDISTLIKFKK